MQMMGGLGNQMFQYALGRRLSIELNTNLKLDLSWFLNQSKRNFELHNYKTSYQLATSDDIDYIYRFSSNKILLKLFMMFQRIIPTHKRKIFYETETELMNKFKLQINKNCYLIGYWQSEKYFTSIKEIIQNDFQLNIQPDNYHNNLANQIKNCNSVSVHFRRGDYLEDEKINSIHGILNNSYYYSSIEFISTLISEPHLFFFSDDIEWVKKNINCTHTCTFINNDCLDKDSKELWLMSQCKHNIIANSSFSWWGAWLNKNRDKVVIAPKKWFINPKMNTDNIVPESWVRL